MSEETQYWIGPDGVKRPLTSEQVSQLMSSSSDQLSGIHLGQQSQGAPATAASKTLTSPALAPPPSYDTVVPLSHHYQQTVPRSPEAEKSSHHTWFARSRRDSSSSTLSSSSSSSSSSPSSSSSSDSDIKTWVKRHLGRATPAGSSSSSAVAAPASSSTKPLTPSETDESSLDEDTTWIPRGPPPAYAQTATLSAPVVIPQVHPGMTIPFSRAYSPLLADHGRRLRDGVIATPAARRRGICSACPGGYCWSASCGAIQVADDAQSLERPPSIRVGAAMVSSTTLSFLGALFFVAGAAAQTTAPQYGQVCSSSEYHHLGDTQGASLPSVVAKAGRALLHAHLAGPARSPTNTTLNVSQEPRRPLAPDLPPATLEDLRLRRVPPPAAPPPSNQATPSFAQW